ncbi:MAG: SDR family NAD(P)-dependent oxidoreductase [Rhodospirillaceae bacterium]|nr:MAG: SDR family NAD(P)-dependent oxidoreductase [Rhodospirillaceae bacterium]
MGKILVTGADGFIGSHLVEALVARGEDVRAFVLYNSFNSWGWLDQAPKNIRGKLDVFAGDVRDAHGVRTAMKDCDTVLHLAALIAIPYSYHSPGAYIDTNVAGTLNIVQAAQDLGVARCIVTSTSEVYGTARFVPITEDHPLQAQSPYAASKIGADQIALSFQKSFGTPVTVIRPFNTYGPRQSARAVIPTVITQLLAGKKSIKLGSLHPTRDFNFVEDTVAGFMAMADAMASRKAAAVIGETINIGSNFEVSIGDTAKLIAEIMGTKLKIETDDARLRPDNSEVERLCAGNAKAKKLLGWSPQYAGHDGLRRGLEKTIAWFSTPGRLEQYKADIYNL